MLLMMMIMKNIIVDDDVYEYFNDYDEDADMVIMMVFVMMIL